MSVFAKVAYAAGSGSAVVNTIVPKIVANIIIPGLRFLFALAVLYFVAGLFVFFISEDSEKRKQGQNHILWSVIGMAIMVSVYGIIRLVANTVGQSDVLGF